MTPERPSDRNVCRAADLSPLPPGALTDEDALFELLAVWEEGRVAGREPTPDALCPNDPVLREELARRIERRRRMLHPDPSPRDRPAADPLGAATYDGGPSARPLPGHLPDVPGYELIGEVGRGGMGVVFRARDRKLNREVALKMVLGGAVAGPAALARFLAEAEALAALHHPNVVQVYDRGEFQGLPFFTMEFCPGGSLGARVRDNPLPPRDAADLVGRLALGAASAHARGVLHRDLKPDNVLFAADGTPKLTDFGLAKRFADAGEAGTGLTHTGAVLGTPSYMAPEQARGDTKRIGPAVDVYALGAILYRLVTGRPPFLRANSAETIRQVIDDEPVSPTQLTPGLPRDLATICLKCLAKEPARRYATAADLAADLRRYLDGRTILARPVGSAERAAKWVKRNPVVTGATLAVVLALAAGAGASYWKYRDAEAARAAEAERVDERDTAIEKRDAAIDRATAALAREADRVRERDTAAREAMVRAADLKYQLAISNVVLAANDCDRGDMATADERLGRVPAENRSWEWYYLKHQVQGGLFTLQGHESLVVAVAVTPDGARVVTGSFDKTARVWDARTGDCVRVLKGHARAITSVAVTPDGARVVTGSFDKTARVWDLRTGDCVRVLRGHSLWVLAVAATPDGSRVVTGSQDHTARIWDARTGDCVRVLKGDLVSFKAVAVTPDGARVVTGSEGTAQVWDARTGDSILVLKSHTGFVTSVAVTPDGARVVTGSDDNTARVWDARTGAPVVTLKGHASSVTAVAVAPDGSRIVTGSLDKTVRIWDARDHQPVTDLPNPVPLLPSHVSADGRVFVRADEARIRLISLAPDFDEQWYRLFWTRPDLGRHAESFARARKDEDRFAAAFHLDRLLAYAPAERPKWLAERTKLRPDHPVLTARTATHSPAIAKADVGPLALRAAYGDPLALRLIGGLLIRNGQPDTAVGPLTMALARRAPDRPPVEELLLALAHAKAGRADAAKAWHAKAVAWLDKYQRPMQMASAVGTASTAGWGGALELFRDQADPRYNPFDWETWYECQVFRAEVEALLVGPKRGRDDDAARGAMKRDPLLFRLFKDLPGCFFHLVGRPGRDARG